jgi:hypothetical protein
VTQLPGKPVYVGREFDQLPPLRRGPVPIFNTSEDFAIWVLPDTADMAVLELADHEPKVNGPKKGTRTISLSLLEKSK